MIRKFGLLLIIVFLTGSVCARKIKLGTFLSTNLKPGAFSTTIPQHGIQTGFETKYVFTNFEFSHSQITPWHSMLRESYTFSVDAGAKIPIYSKNSFNFSIPATLKFSYYYYHADSGDSSYDTIKRPCLGGSIHLNFEWKIVKKLFFFLDISSYVQGRLNDYSTYSHSEMADWIDHSDEKFYTGIIAASGISYKF